MKLKLWAFQIRSTSMSVPCQWSCLLLALESPWRRSLTPPGDSWPPGDLPGAAPRIPQPAAIGQEGQRWQSGWWRHRWSRGRPSEEGTRWLLYYQQTDRTENTHFIPTDREAVEDDVLMWRGRGACCQGNCAVIGQAEWQALTGRRLEVVGPRGASWL